MTPGASAGRVLVTGATGFVGRALISRLAQTGEFPARAAVRRPPAAAWAPGTPRTVPEQVVVGDIDGTTGWAEALAGVEGVVHLAARVHVMRDAARDPLAEFRRVNVDGTLALARQAANAGVRRFVYLSSVKVNGEAGRFTEQDAVAPADPYGISKHEAETGLRELAGASGMEVVIIRPPLVYGPGVKANFRALQSAVFRGMPLPLGAVHNLRSLVAVDNLVDLIIVALSHPGAGNQTFFVSDGEDLSTAELITRMGHAVNRNARLIPVPVWMLQAGAFVLGKRAVAQRVLGSLQVDITKARTLLGWTPPIGVDEALRRAARAQ